MPQVADMTRMPLNFARIKELRLRNKWTQRQAADRVEPPMSVQRWNDIESGRKADISLATLDRIAKALGVKASELLK
jgi:transcriptional regulator with XRE-family HTH domain